MEASILNDVKKYLGSFPDYDAFDQDLIMNVNAAFFTLFQLGVGCKKRSFVINDSNALWSDFSKDQTIISAIKQYVFLKVKNTFDPPTSGYVLSAYERQIEELEWRLRELSEGMFANECICEGDMPCCCNDSHTLPIATLNSLGGVMIGDNVSVDDEGRISVSSIDLVKDETIPSTDVDDMLDRIFGSPLDSKEKE